MLVPLLLVSSLAVARPPQVHSALETLSTCKDIQAEACMFAAAWLKMGGDPAMPEVLKAAPGMTQAGQILTISAIGSVPGSDAVTETLGRLAEDARLDSLARSLAVEKLSTRQEPKKKRGKKAAKGPLETALVLASDHDATVRQAAVRLIAQRIGAKDKALLGVIGIAAKDVDGGVRSEAVTGFGMCGCADAPKVLEGALKDGDARVRRAAAESLAAVKHPVVVPILVELMTSYDEAMNRILARALRFQSGQALGESPDEWKRWLAQRN